MRNELLFTIINFLLKFISSTFLELIIYLFFSYFREIISNLFFLNLAIEGFFFSFFF
jgi:hypothetical protein